MCCELADYVKLAPHRSDTLLCTKWRTDICDPFCMVTDVDLHRRKRNLTFPKAPGRRNKVQAKQNQYVFRLLSNLTTQHVPRLRASSVLPSHAIALSAAALTLQSRMSTRMFKRCNRYHCVDRQSGMAGPASNKPSAATSLMNFKDNKGQPTGRAEPTSCRRNNWPWLVPMHTFLSLQPDLAVTAVAVICVPSISCS